MVLLATFTKGIVSVRCLKHGVASYVLTGLYSNPMFVLKLHIETCGPFSYNC